MPLPVLPLFQTSSFRHGDQDWQGQRLFVNYDLQSWMSFGMSDFLVPIKISFLLVLSPLRSQLTFEFEISSLTIGAAAYGSFCQIK